MTDTGESLHFLDYWRVIRSRQEIVIAVSLLVILTGVLITYSMPKVYKATAVIQVQPDAPDLETGLNFSRDTMRYDPLFLRTQYEIIQSRTVIEETIQKLGLNEKLGRAYGYLDELGPASFEQTCKIVAKSMKVKQYRDTNLIAVEMYMSEPKDEAPQLAALTATTIAEIYQELNLRRTREVVDRALKAIQDSLIEQEKKVEEAQTRVNEIRRTNNITVYGAPTGPEAGPDTTVTVRMMSEQMVRSRLELEEKRARHDKVMSLKPEELVQASFYLAPDPALAELVAAKRNAEVQLGELQSKAGLGAQHPDVLRAKAQIQELGDKINDAIDGLRTGVQTEFEAAKAKMAAMEKMMDASKETDIESLSSGYRDYFKANEELQHAKKIRDALEYRYRSEKIERKIPRTNVDIIESAKPADKNDPVSPKLLLNILLSIFVGLCSGVGLAYFVEYLDTSVKTIEEVERSMRVSVLGVIPQRVKAFIEDSQGAHVEAYRVLRTNIRFSKKQKDIRALCVTSGSVGEGKSLTLFNLSYVCAQMGDKVLLIDSDLHRPRQHKILGVSNSIGLANVLTGEVDIEEAIVPTSLPNLHFLPSGKLSSSAGIHGLLDNQKLNDLIALFKENYDFTFFDAPPIIGVSDASLLVGKMDGVLLVIQHRKHPRSISIRAKDMVENIGANLLGVVLNNINITRDYSYYYHYYSYPYQAKQPSAGPAA